MISFRLDCILTFIYSNSTFTPDNEKHISSDTLVSSNTKNNSLKTSTISDSDTTSTPTKITYCVQIGAYSEIDLNEFKDNLVSLKQESINGVNQLTLGHFNNYEKRL